MCFKVDDIVAGGRDQRNLPQQAAVFLCQQHGDHRLKDIAMVFGLSRYSCVAYAIVKFKKI
ncbi:MAG: chromosomal replication initiation ATPase DnaA [Cellvibrionaceae bacterium]|jgi:chromosomal replication initiation ATPase DnaA